MNEIVTRPNIMQILWLLFLGYEIESNVVKLKLMELRLSLLGKIK